MMFDDNAVAIGELAMRLARGDELDDWDVCWDDCGPRASVYAAAADEAEAAARRGRVPALRVAAAPDWAAIPAAWTLAELICGHGHTCAHVDVRNPRPWAALAPRPGHVVCGACLRAGSVDWTALPCGGCGADAPTETIKVVTGPLITYAAACWECAAELAAGALAGTALRILVVDAATLGRERHRVAKWGLDTPGVD
ncbi:MAG: hypothetical protein IPM90_11005 [Austwickia sp.]|nr:hypothetical protein [Austwickia sp.]